MGYDFQVIDYTGSLYRSDTFSLIKRRPLNVSGTPPRGNNLRPDPNYPTLASDSYADKNIKYFTTNRNIAEKEYVPQGAPYLYDWCTLPGSPLILLDMTHRQTRDNLIAIAENQHKKEAIGIAFPLSGNHVHRFSSRNTQSKNDISFRVICTLPVDGFYVPETNVAGYQFHPEIGLCHRAFHKIKLEKIQKFMVDMSAVGNSWRVGMHAVNRGAAAAAAIAAPALGATAAASANNAHLIARQNKAARNEARQAARAARIRNFGRSGTALLNFGSAAAPAPFNFGSAVAPAVELANNENKNGRKPPKIQRKKSVKNNSSRKLSGSKRSRNKNSNQNNSEREGLGVPPPAKKRRTKKQRHI